MAQRSYRARRRLASTRRRNASLLSESVGQLSTCLGGFGEQGKPGQQIAHAPSGHLNHVGVVCGDPRMVQTRARGGALYAVAYVPPDFRDGAKSAGRSAHLLPPNCKVVRQPDIVAKVPRWDCALVSGIGDWWTRCMLGTPRPDKAVCSTYCP